MQEIKVFQPNNYPLTNGMRLIEASAGTGKTFALSHLVLRLVTEKRYSINELLVITFTEAAAAELKSRVNKRLTDALEGLFIKEALKEVETDKVLKEWLNKQSKDSTERKRIAGLILEAIEGIDRSDITTIHGFCKRTIDREALESEVPINPILEGEGKPLILKIVHEY